MVLLNYADTSIDGGLAKAATSSSCSFCQPESRQALWQRCPSLDKALLLRSAIQTLNDGCDKEMLAEVVQ